MQRPYHNNEEIFIISAKHLLEQNDKSVVDKSDMVGKRTENNGSNCRYRLLKNGKMLKCAIGCLIPDSMYNKQMERVSIRGILEGIEEYRPLFRNCSVFFLVDLQDVHDRYPIDTWKLHFKRLIKTYNLDFEPSEIEFLNENEVILLPERSQ